MEISKGILCAENLRNSIGYENALNFEVSLKHYLVRPSKLFVPILSHILGGPEENSTISQMFTLFNYTHTGCIY